jgi:hypothetical protein
MELTVKRIKVLIGLNIIEGRFQVTEAALANPYQAQFIKDVRINEISLCNTFLPSRKIKEYMDAAKQIDEATLRNSATGSQRMIGEFLSFLKVVEKQ